MSGYPVVLNCDHAEFEAEWAGKDPKTRPDWPLPSFDARDWAEAFDHFNPGHNIPEGVMLGWFANSLMRGFDERASRSATPAPDKPPGVPDGLREKIVGLCNSVLGQAYLGKEPESDLAQEVKTLISAQPAGQSEQPILRVTVDVFADRTDTRLTFGDRIRPEPGVKAVEQAIAALTAEYEARGGCPAVGRHPVGQADDLPDPETAQTNLARIGAAMGLQSKPVAWLLEKPDGETHISECRPRDDWKDGTVTPLYAAPTIQPAGQAGDAGAEARRMAEGCCSVVSPCSHQRSDPYSICSICTQAASISKDRRGVLLEIIRTRLLGVPFDEQDLELEDDDWLLIISALAPAPNSTRTGAAEMEEAVEKMAWIILANLRTDVSVADIRRKLDEEQSGRFGLGRSWSNELDKARRQARAILAARPEAPSDAGWRERVRHVKRGTEYEVLGEAEAQVSEGMKRYGMPGATRLINDGSLLTVYLGSNGKLWCRFTDEFRDGRFETIAPPSDPAPSGQAEG